MSRARPELQVPESQSTVGVYIIDTTSFMNGFPASAFVEPIKDSGFGIRVDKDVTTILTDHRQDLREIGAIIWSHWHFDHSGDPTTFPASIDLIVGPGFRDRVMPGYPTNPASHVDERAWQGRALHEIDFTPGAPQTLQRLCRCLLFLLQCLVMRVICSRRLTTSRIHCEALL